MQADAATRDGLRRRLNSDRPQGGTGRRGSPCSGAVDYNRHRSARCGQSAGNRDCATDGAAESNMKNAMPRFETSRDAKRAHFFALAGAVVRWISVLIFGILFWFHSPASLWAAVGGLALLWIPVLYVAYQLRCPVCAARIAISDEADVRRNWADVKESFLPMRAWRDQLIDCPHCAAAVSLERDAK